jgi:hypothetical protein
MMECQGYPRVRFCEIMYSVTGYLSPQPVSLQPGNTQQIAIVREGTGFPGRSSAIAVCNIHRILQFLIIEVFCKSTNNQMIIPGKKGFRILFNEIISQESPKNYSTISDPTTRSFPPSR